MAEKSDDSRDAIMPDKPEAETGSGEPEVYQIRLKGHLAPEWSDWFGGMALTLEDSGETLLTGTLVDQAALHGLLSKLRDLGLSLISVNLVGPGRKVDPGS